MSGLEILLIEPTFLSGVAAGAAGMVALGLGYSFWSKEEEEYEDDSCSEDEDDEAPYEIKDFPELDGESPSVPVLPPDPDGAVLTLLLLQSPTKCCSS